MKSLCLSVLCLAALAVSGSVAPAAHAGGGCGWGYGMGYGYGSFPGYGVPDCISVRTPPYFAVHPPVYYSTRYARPYGISPFAAPPQVHVPDSYRARLESEFVRPPLANPFCCASDAVPAEEVTAADDFVAGAVRVNPFVEADAHVARRD